jgi:uncharacterized protein GlcG (DUF336 family)
MTMIRSIVYPAVAVALVGAALVPAPSRAADVLATHRLSAAFATEIATDAVGACAKLGYAVTAAVVDADGVTQALIRGDGAGIHTVQTAQDKAFTAVTYRSATSAVKERFKSSGPAEVIEKEPRLIGADGGLPLNVGTETVGALGISGSPGQDEVCGNAAIDLVRSRLK